MTDWFIHDPAEGRIGPLATDAVRERYRQRRIQRDTLVWHAGMREWQPLDRVSDVVGIDDVVPDAALPPPLPPSSPRATPMHATAAQGRAAHLRAAPPPRRGMSGCAIVVLVLAVVSIPLVAILAAIALPAYQDYTIRAKVAGAVAQAATLQAPLLAARGAGGRCPGADAPGLTGALPAAAQLTGLQVGSLDDGRCAYQVTLANTHPKVDGQTLLFAMPPAEGAAWHCESSLADRYLPALCRTAPSTR